MFQLFNAFFVSIYIIQLVSIYIIQLVSIYIVQSFQFILFRKITSLQWILKALKKLDWIIVN